jgi:DNA polymerase-3 subunit chi
MPRLRNVAGNYFSHIPYQQKSLWTGAKTWFSLICKRLLSNIFALLSINTIFKCNERKMLNPIQTNQPCVNFHLPSLDNEGCEHYLANLIEKMYLENFEIYVVTRSEQASQKMDQFLWSFRDDSFLPHQIVEEGGFDAPILISHRILPDPNHYVVINLKDEMADLRFKSIIEFVYPNEAAKAIARKKYREYQQHGCKLQIIRNFKEITFNG